MKIIYHQSHNIGDFINEIVFDEILKLPHRDNEVVLGIGTILGLKKPRENFIYHVFGSGISHDQLNTYGKFDQSKIDQYVFHGVRGPITANSVNYHHPPLISGDFAYLLPSKIQPTKNFKSEKVGFIPHKDSLRFYDDWGPLLKKYKIHFISPLLAPQEFVDEIHKCERVMCEAMHGAILCDAYRIPWLPVFTFGGISKSKWNDWLLSMKHENISFKYLRGPRNAHWKTEKLQSLLGSKCSGYLANQFEHTMAMIFSVRLWLLSRRGQFYLSPLETVSHTIALQSKLLVDFVECRKHREKS